MKKPFTENQMTDFAIGSLNFGLRELNLSVLESVESCARVVGRKARSEGWSEGQLQKWFQVGYGAVFVVSTSLKLQHDLKDLAKISVESFRRHEASF
jgi:hypothetical protein